MEDTTEAEWVSRLRHHEPVCVNEGSYRSELDLKKMRGMLPLVDSSDRDRLEQDIKMLSVGIAGEHKIDYALRSSRYPLIFIHDLCLQYDGITAQIDFLVITHFNVFVIECKNMIGDIEVDPQGTFIRTVKDGRYRRREAMFSPITQNDRHIAVLRGVLGSGRGELVRFLQRHTLNGYFHSVVVLANEKTLLSADSAPRDVREKIVRCDQLVKYIRDLDRRMVLKNPRDSSREMVAYAQSWLRKAAPYSSTDLVGKYHLAQAQKDVANSKQTPPVVAPKAVHPVVIDRMDAESVPRCPLCGAPMELRKARRGQYKGREFWGCSMFGVTKCRGIVNTDYLM